MDLSLSDVQAMLSDSVEKFVGNDYQFETRQKYAGSELGYSAEVWQQFAELGWTAVPFSEADGGFDGGPIELAILMRHFGRGLIVEPYLANIVLAGGVLKRSASDEQKEQWLQPIIAGEKQAALAFVEPQSRYDIANIATMAITDGDGWLINGSKGVVFNGESADVLIVSARTSGGQHDTDGITLFAVHADGAGITRKGYPTVDGLRAGRRLYLVR